MNFALITDFTLLSQSNVLEPVSKVDFLSSGQYNLVYNAFSFAIAIMFAAALFFFSMRGQVGQKYQLALIVYALMVSIAGYYFYRIFVSWEAANSLQNGNHILTGAPFNDVYRYMDWLLTEPLLLVETAAIFAVPGIEDRPLPIKLVVGTILVIATGQQFRIFQF